MQSITKVKNVSDIVIEDCVIAHFLKNNPDLITKADTIVNQYKHYIFLLTTCSKPLRVPSEEVDELWHSHVLHTRNYALFCKNVAGKFIHYSPFQNVQTALENLISIQDLYSKSINIFGLDDFNLKINNSNVDCSTHSCNSNCMGPCSVGCSSD